MPPKRPKRPMPAVVVRRMLSQRRVPRTPYLGSFNHEAVQRYADYTSIPLCCVTHSALSLSVGGLAQIFNTVVNPASVKSAEDSQAASGVRRAVLSKG